MEPYGELRGILDSREGEQGPVPCGIDDSPVRAFESGGEQIEMLLMDLASGLVAVPLEVCRRPHDVAEDDRQPFLKPSSKAGGELILQPNDFS
jgi:hypothetical protein